MGSVYSSDLISQLNLGEGKTWYGDTPLMILKSFLQSGVSYVGGYPGAPTVRLIDVISDAYEIYGLLPNIIVSLVIKIINNTQLKDLKQRLLRQGVING